MKYIVILIMMLASFSASAIPETELVLTTEIPEDYGIEFPEAIHLDHLYFSVQTTPTVRDFIRTDTIDTGSITSSDGYYRLKLLYYGNLSRPYNVMLSAESDGGFRSSDHTADSIPLDIRFERPGIMDDAFSVDINDDGSAHLHINTDGPVRGVEALDMIFTWTPASDTVPGEYVADIVVRMEAM